MLQIAFVLAIACALLLVGTALGWPLRRRPGGLGTSDPAQGVPAHEDVPRDSAGEEILGSLQKELRSALDHIAKVESDFGRQAELLQTNLELMEHYATEALFKPNSQFARQIKTRMEEEIGKRAAALQTLVGRFLDARAEVERLEQLERERSEREKKLRASIEEAAHEAAEEMRRHQIETDAKNRELGSLRKTIATREEELASSRERERQLEDERERLTRELEGAAEDNDSLRDEQESLRKELSGEREQRARETHAHERALEALNEHIHEIERARDDQLCQAESRYVKLDEERKEHYRKLEEESGTRIAELQQEIAQLDQKIQAQTDAAGSRADELTKERDEAQKTGMELEGLAAERLAEIQRLERQTDGLQEELQGRDERIQEFEREVDRTNKRIEARQEELSESVGSARRLEDERDRVSSELEAAKAELESRGSLLDSTRVEVESWSERYTQLEAERDELVLET
ncbi:MAG: hypothetical protein O7B99_03075, partial [Planctomycetota bacterium]|nr:hypothetical protein [Planctomycetota bacterium]